MADENQHRSIENPWNKEGIYYLGLEDLFKKVIPEILRGGVCADPIIAECEGLSPDCITAHFAQELMESDRITLIKMMKEGNRYIG